MPNISVMARLDNASTVFSIRSLVVDYSFSSAIGVPLSLINSTTTSKGSISIASRIFRGFVVDVRLVNIVSPSIAIVAIPILMLGVWFVTVYL